MSPNTPASRPEQTASESSLLVTTASETHCSALAAYGRDPETRQPTHQFHATLTVGGVLRHEGTADILLGLEVECVTDRGDSRTVLMSDALTCDDLEALIAVLTAVRDRARREGILSTPEGVSHPSGDVCDR